MEKALRVVDLEMFVVDRLQDPEKQSMVNVY
jgi:hypothetical protein